MDIEKKTSLRRAVFAWILAILLVYVPQAPAQQTKKDEPADFFEMSIEELMEIEVVSGSRKVEKIRETPSNITIVTQQQIKEWGSRNLQDVLKRVAGYYMVRDRDEWVWAARGSVSDNNQKYLVLIDGHKMNSINNFGPGQIIELPNDLSNVKRIEIIRGPGSAVWGSGALAGVVNIITKDAADLGAYKQHTSATYGQNDTIKTNFQVGKTKEDFDWILHGSYVTSNGTTVTQSAATSTFPILDFQYPWFGNSNAHPHGLYETDLNRYDDGYMLYFKGNRDKFSLNALAFSTSVFNRHYESGKGRENFLSTEKYFVESGYRDTFGEWKFAGKAFFHFNGAEYENKKNENDRPSYLEKEWLDRSVGSTINLSRQLSEMLSLNCGIEYTFTRTGPDDAIVTAQTAPFNVTKTTAHFEDHDIGSYALLEYFLTNELKFVAGGGASYNDRRGRDPWVFSPRGGVIWHASEDTTHKFLYNSAFFRPATFQASNNSRVDSEKMEQFEYMLMKSFGQASLTTTLYTQELEGFINILNLGGGNTQFNNSGDYRSKGIEIEFSTPFHEDHSLWTNAAYSDTKAGDFPANLPFNSRRVNPEGELLSYPDFTFNIGGTFRFLQNKLFVSPALRYVNAVEYRATPAQTASLTDATYRDAGSFTYLDLNIGYEPSTNLGFYIGLHNITNVDDKNHLSIWNGTIEQPGRYMEITMAYRF